MRSGDYVITTQLRRKNEWYVYEIRDTRTEMERRSEHASEQASLSPWSLLFDIRTKRRETIQLLHNLTTRSGWIEHVRMGDTCLFQLVFAFLQIEVSPDSRVFPRELHNFSPVKIVEESRVDFTRELCDTN